MAAHSFQNGGDDDSELPEVVPFELPHLTRLSWELGSRIVDGDDSTFRGEWENAGTSWRLSVYRVTGNTGIVQIETPVGRGRFYGATLSDLESAFDALHSAPRWRRLD